MYNNHGSTLYGLGTAFLLRVDSLLGLSVPCLIVCEVCLCWYPLALFRVFDNTFTVVTRQVTEMLEGNVIAAHRFIRVSA